MAILRVTIDRKTGKEINKQIIPSDFKPDKTAFFKWLANYIIETKGIDFYKKAVSTNEHCVSERPRSLAE